MDFIIIQLLKTCPSLRDTLRSGHVSRIKTTFYPYVAGDGTPHCHVFVNLVSKEVPASLFETGLNEAQDGVAYCRAVSYNMEDKQLKIRLTVAPLSDDNLECRYFDSSTDESTQLSTTGLQQLAKSFKLLWIDGQPGAKSVSSFM